MIIIRKRKPVTVSLDHYKFLRYIHMPVECAEETEKSGIVLKSPKGVLVLPIGQSRRKYGKKADKNFEKLAASESVSMKRVIEKLKKVAKNEYSVIIQGETGTGKSLLALAIHELSARAGKPFIRVDINTIPETLVESELFGYEKGSFTGADKKKKGLFKLAHKGSIFIDELQNLSPHIQGKLLTIAEDKKLYPIGSSRSSKIDARIIAATNVDIKQSLADKKIREDLYYRLSEFIIALPPLRERRRDIPVLARSFLKEICDELSLREKTFSENAMSYLLNYQWPGNVRELKNVIKRVVLLCDALEIDVDDLKAVAEAKESEVDESPILPLKEVSNKSVRESESKAIARALHLTNGNKAKAATHLQIDYKTLLTKIKEYNIPTKI